MESKEKCHEVKYGVSDPLDDISECISKYDQTL